jgi:1-deoxy-D-xylulose-5-phosphate reductoisomerase
MEGRSRVTILGSTGSIGTSTLDVIARNADRYEVYALTAFHRLDVLFDQCCRFRPRFAVMPDQKLARDLRDRLNVHGVDTQVLSGEQGLVEVATDNRADTVMAAIVGAAGLPPTLAAAKAGKKILLANKESLVMSGNLFMSAVRESGAQLLPIDSEHNAIFQCLPSGNVTPQVSKLLLTASGGPLLREPLDRLQFVTPEQACAHPNWRMGRKISVDSATMMNKGLELIEASLLFDMAAAQIDVVIHPQSIIHSMVEYIDGSVLAQLGQPDMRTPIAYGLAWPERIESGVPFLDLVQIATLNFESMDLERFPCLKLAKKVIGGHNSGDSAVLNAANEIAVQAFLDELIRFTDIPIVVEQVMEQIGPVSAHSIEEVLALDANARRLAIERIGR